MQAPPSRRNWHPLSRFLLVGAVGFAIDGGLLSWLLGQGWSIVQARAFEALRQMPLIPLAAGAAVAIAFNFSISRVVVFSRSHP